MTSTTLTHFKKLIYCFVCLLILHVEITLLKLPLLCLTIQSFSFAHLPVCFSLVSTKNMIISIECYETDNVAYSD